MIQNNFFAALFNTYTPDSLEADKITYDKNQKALIDCNDNFYSGCCRKFFYSFCG